MSRGLCYRKEPYWRQDEVMSGEYGGVHHSLLARVFYLVTVFINTRKVLRMDGIHPWNGWRDEQRDGGRMHG